MSTENRVKFHRITAGRRLLPSLTVAILMALLIFHAPAYAQADSHQVEVSLEVNEDRFRIEMPNLLPPGPTTLNITNNTEIAHDFAMVGEAIEPLLIEQIAPGETQSVDLDLEEGVYLAFSPVLNYAALGMETVIFATDQRINPAVEGESAADATTIVTDTAATTGTNNIVSMATNNENLSTLVGALQAAGLVETLQGDGPYTVFAPTNEAFDALPQDTLDQLMAEPEGYLSEILQYHVVEGQLLADDLSDGQVIETLQGDDLVVTIEGDAVRINDATVISSDNEASNGVVHLIDNVLMPVTEEAPDADVSEAVGAPTSEDPVEGDEALDDEDLPDNGEIDDIDAMTGTDTMTGTVVLQAGDRVITQEEFDRMFLRTLRSFAAQTGLPLNASTLPIFEELRQRYLVQLAMQETLLAEAERRGIEVQDSEIENVVMNARQNFGSDEEFQQALNAAGFADEAEFREAARQEALIGEVMLQLGQEITVSDAEISAFYEENQDLFTIAPGVVRELGEVSTQIQEVLELRKLQEMIGGLQQDATVEIFAGNLMPLIEVLQQQIPRLQDSGTMTDTGTITDTETSTTTDTISGMSDVRTATATLMNTEDEVVGSAVFTQVDGEPVRIELTLEDITSIDAGAHGIHIHETGACTPDFSAAGGHFNPTGAQHGLDNPEGPHAGDFPNLEISSDATSPFTAVVQTDRITLGDGETSLFDGDGSALIIHADEDDQMTEPAGESGDLVICGVIEPGTNTAADAAN